MQQTNYYIFDWMDFDSDLSKDESLWKAYEPTAVIEADGDILITVPYQKQVLQEDMLADTGVPQRDYTLRLRAYGDAVVRVFTSMAGDEMSDESHILDIHPDMKRLPLHVTLRDGIYTITDADGKTRAVIDTTPYKTEWWSDLQPGPQPTIRLTIYPDGDLSKGVELSDDHFSPPRYDALPIGFCLTDGTPDRATMSFRCEAGECFAGTGERFRKMDLSGQTFYLKNQDGQGVNNRRAYKNVPFYLSSRMYGVFYHTYDYCRLSLAAHSTRSVQFRNDRATIDEFVGVKAALESNLDTFHFREAQKEAMNLARIGNKYLAETEPWKLAKTDMARVATVMNVAMQITANLAIAFEPFLPFSAEKLRGMISLTKLDWNKLGSTDIIAAGTEIAKPELLFEKIEDATIDAQIQRLENIKKQNEIDGFEPAPVAENIDFEQFMKLDIRVGKVLECAKVPKADKLLQFKIDDGMGGRTIVSGIAKHYNPEDLVGKEVCFVANLAPRKLKGIESQGMILSAEDAGGRLVVIGPHGEVKPGAQVK